jgi:hypothetical protein
MKIPAIIQDTITLVATPLNGSASVNTSGQNYSFSIGAGIPGTSICTQTVNAGADATDVHITITPDPFTETAVFSISSAIPAGQASLVIYDYYGRDIQKMTDNTFSCVHSFVFSPKENNMGLAKGVYYYIFSAGNARAAGKIIFAG